MKGEKDYILVIGNTNIDLKGKVEGKLMYKTCNDGSINIAAGGVGRNIAANLSKLGINVKFITALGKDFYAQFIKDDAKSIGLDLIPIYSSHRNTNTFLAILNPSGDMELAVADIGTLEDINLDTVKDYFDIIKNAKMIVADANLSYEVLDYILTIANKYNILSCIEPAAIYNVKKVKMLINKINIITPNLEEAEAIYGKRITISNIHKVAKYFISLGLDTLLITLGKDGVYYASQKQEFALPAIDVPVIDTTGAGDSFTAAYLAAKYYGYSDKDALYYGQLAASYTIRTKDSVYQNLSKELIFSKKSEKYN